MTQKMQTNTQKSKIEAGQREERNALSLSMFTQIMLCLCYGLFGHVGSSAWQTVVFTCPFAFLLFFCSKNLSVPSEKNALKMLFVPLLLLDGCMMSLALIDLLTAVALPFHSKLLLVICIFLSVYVPYNVTNDSAFARMAKLLLKPLLFVLIFSLVTSLNVMDISFITPIGGFSIVRTALASVLPLSVLWQIALPFLLNDEKGHKHSIGFFLYPLLLSLLTVFLLCTFSPMEELYRPLAPSKRMMQFEKTSASTFTFSLVLFAWLFVLLNSLSNAVRVSTKFLSEVVLVPYGRWIFSFLLLGAMCVFAFFSEDETTKVLYQILPYRYPYALLCVLFLRRVQ